MLKKIIARVFIGWFVGLHNFAYRVINKLVVWEGRGVHPKHRILNYHQFFLDNVQATDSVLDLGCGHGAVAYDVAGKARRVVGIDKRAGSIQYARKHYARPNLEFICADAFQHDWSGRRFDKIIFSNVLEHIAARVEFLKRLRGLSDVILLRVPLITRDWLTVYKKERGFEYRLDPTHFVEYTEDAIKQELASAGWRADWSATRFGEFLAVCKPL